MYNDKNLFLNFESRQPHFRAKARLLLAIHFFVKIISDSSGCHGQCPTAVRIKRHRSHSRRKPALPPSRVSTYVHFVNYASARLAPSLKDCVLSFVFLHINKKRTRRFSFYLYGTPKRIRIAVYTVKVLFDGIL